MKTLRILTIVDEVKVIGLVLHTSFQDGRNKTDIPAFFHQVLEEAKLAQVPHRLNQNQMCVFNFAKNSPEFDYLMGVEVEWLDEIPAGMESIILPTGQYVVLTMVKRGPEDVGQGFQYVNEKWLPQSAYKPTGTPSFIYYDERFFSVFDKQGYAGNPIVDLYIPIQPKE
jgi:predicted transcriptional regulator YdeE